MLERILITMLLIGICAAPALPQTDTGLKEEGDFEVIWGSDYRIPQGHSPRGYIGTPQRDLTQISMHHGKVMTMQSFDENLSLRKAEDTPISHLPKDLDSEGVYSLGSRYFWFYSSWNKKSKKELFYAQAINPATAAFEGGAVLVNECGKITPESYFSKKYHNFFSESKYKKTESYDDGLIMISYRGHPEFRNDAKNIDRIGFLILDTMMNKVSGSELKMPYTEEKMDNLDFAVDGRGNAYYLIKVYDGPRKEENEDGTPNYHFEILRIPAGSNAIEILPLALNRPYIRSITIAEDVNGHLSCFGFYSNDAETRLTHGFFITRIDSGGSLIKEQADYVDFPDEMLDQLQTIKRQRSQGSGSEDRPEWSKLRLRNVRFNMDGSLIIAGEEYYSYNTTHTKYTSKSYRTYTITHYVYNDMVVMKADANGDVIWWHRIPKTQYGTRGKGGLSFHCQFSDDDVYLFYLDNDKNKNLPPDVIPAVHMDGMGGILCYAKVDKDGVLTRKQMFDLRLKNVDIEPDNLRSIKDGHILTRSKMKDDYKFILFRKK